jgi:Flp pilus assembly protein protease CpaA
LPQGDLAAGAKESHCDFDVPVAGKPGNQAVRKGERDVMEWMMGGAVIAAAAAAAWFDVRERRVPNALTLPLLLLAVLASLIDGLPGLGMSLAGAGLCFAFAIPLFLVGGLGGGDVKLLTAFGAFLGPDRLLLAFVTMAFVGGGLALVEMIRRRAVVQTFRNIVVLFMTFGRGSWSGWKGGGVSAWRTIHSPGAVTVPYAVAISAGAVFAWFA